MAWFGSNSDDKWKQKYQQLESDFKAFKKESRGLEADLRESLDNVSFAAEGIDQELDFQLKRIRVQLGSRAEPAHLCNTSRAIAEAKKRVNKQMGNNLKETIKKLIEFSYSLPNANEIKSEVQEIAKQLKQAEDQDIPKILQSLIQLLKTGSPQGASAIGAKKSDGLSWYQKLFRFGNKSLHLEPLTTILNYLISHLNVPPHLQNELFEIKSMVSSEEEQDILNALDLASQLVIKVHQSNEAQFNSFLDEINSQISFIEEILFKQEQNYSHQKDHTERFGKNFNDYFTNLSSEVTGYDNLEKLKSHMANSIQMIMGKVKTYTNEQMDIHSQQQKEISRLNERLRETELVTHALIDELSKTTLEALKDPLTELPNRAAYDKRVEEEFARWRRYKHALTIIVCDIDHFKKINDTYGHKAGDKVLNKVAQKLKETLRKIDFVGRYGGEEFVVLIEKVSLDDAITVANKLRTEIAAMGFHFNNQPVSVTCSFGLTQFVEDDNIESAFERADKALYESKNKGRNQVNFL